MSDVKKQLMKEIEERIAKKNAAKSRALYNQSIENFVHVFIKRIEDINAMVSTRDEWIQLSDIALRDFVNIMKSYDYNVRIQVKYTEIDSVKSAVDKVIINWSTRYQKENSTQESLTLDAVDLMLLDV